MSEGTERVQKVTRRTSVMRTPPGTPRGTRTLAPVKKEKIVENPTKRSRHRAYVFTINNYSSDDIKLLEEMIENEKHKYIIYGFEKGETGTPHIQGYASFASAKDFKIIKEYLPRAHIEAAKGDPYQNFVYCSKDGKFEESGERPEPKKKGQGRRNDIHEVKEAVAKGANMREIISIATSYQSLRYAELVMKYVEAPRTEPAEVHWYWGDSGIGKSATVQALAPNAWWTNNGLTWFDGYDGHEDVVFDDFRQTWTSFDHLLRLFDRYSLMVAIKGGFRQWKPKRIFITCPYHPYELWGNDKKNWPQIRRRISVILHFGAILNNLLDFYPQHLAEKINGYAVKIIPLDDLS